MQPHPRLWCYLLPVSTSRTGRSSSYCGMAWRMSELPWIRCPGCNAIVAPTRPVCPGCGHCINCGQIRAKEVKQCPKCDIQYCDCCGRCPKCLELRYEDIGPCDCGHPADQEKLERLVRYNAVKGAQRPPMPIGCIAAIVVMLGVLIFGIVWMLR